jgi:hypothetical protein
MVRIWLACGLAVLVSLAGCKQEAAPPAAAGTDAAAPAEESVDLGAPAVSEAAPAATTDAPAVAAAPMPSVAPPAATAAPAVAAATAGGAVDLRFVDDQAALTLVVRPAQALGNPVVQGVVKAVEESTPDFKLSDRLAEMSAQLGFDMNDVDHTLVIVDQQQLAMALQLGSMFLGPPAAPPEFQEQPATPADPGMNCDDQPQPGGDTVPPELTEVPGAGPSMSPLVTIKFKKAIDAEKVASASGGKAETKTHAGQTYYLKADGTAQWMMDPTLLVIASEPKVMEFIDGKFGTPGPLAQKLEPLAGRDAAVVLDVQPLHSFVGAMAEQNPMAAMAGGLVKQVNTLTLVADLQGANLLQLQLHALNEGSASGLQGMIGGFLQQGQQAFTQQLKAEQGHMEPGMEPLIPLIEKLVQGSTCTAEGSICSITVPRPEGTEQLPELLKPALQRMADQAAAARELNDLRQIALAFHNYHDTHGAFPASGGPGTAGAPGTGLSWRVHLLPFLEQSALYQEFKLDEPWDSEHNKALIPRMPEVYGKDSKGLTSTHVFVGEGAPFVGDTGAKFFEITDGTSNTLLIVEAGPSTAVEWTKPGGLTLDPANPLAVLGEIGDMFAVAMMDGSARKLPKSIDPETFKNLVNPKDGNPVNVP